MSNISDYTFRDKPININTRGGRNWIYAKKPRGKWYSRRTLVSILVLAFFVAVPFIKVNGYPFMLLDIPNRKFIIFGTIFWAQDTFILALIMLTFVLFIIVFTVTFGRVWCGWLCPQTIFLEMVFRKVEYLIEGDSRAQQKLDAAPWNADKIMRKTAKVLIFLLIAFAMTTVFLMWFIGPERTWNIISDPFGANLRSFLIMLLVTGVFYWIYSFFREQICTMVCPYGRIQGILLDSKTQVVTYDYVRGEPRGKEGDCINCKQCIVVCPTGIDIRNGTQLECVNCLACVDECNHVMRRVKKPENLIRIDSLESVRTGKRTLVTPRNLAYTVILLGLLTALVFMFSNRSPLETTILRTPGLLFQTYPDGNISNLYNITIVNKTHEDMDLELKLLSHEGRVAISGNRVFLPDHGRYESTFLTYIPAAALQAGKNELLFGIYHNGELVEDYSITFMGPN